MIPLVKHFEYFQPISNELYKSYEQYDQTTLKTLFKIEKMD